MIKYVKHVDIDKEKWNACISNARNASFYALSDVLDLTSPNWDALVCDDYLAVFPLPWRKKMGVKYVYPPFFSTQLGLFSEQEMDVSPFFEMIPKEFRYVEYKLNIQNSTPESLRVMQQNRTFHLDLSQTYEELSASFSKNHKQNVRKATHAQLELQKAGDPKPIIELFRLNKGAMSAFSDGDYQTLLALVYHWISQGKAEVWSVFDETNTLCAGGFFITDFQKKVFLFSGSNEVAKEKRAMFFLFDNYIRKYASTPYVLDFGGSNDDNLARFYEGFGSKAYYFDTIRIDRTGRFVRWLRRLSKR